MATVHLARAHGAGGFERLVALKVMHPHLAADPDFVDMFLDEARLAARIHHPNVVGTSDVQEDPSGLFLVMDYIEGAALQVILRDLWRRGETFRLDVALRIFLDALAGLHAAHELLGADGQPLHVVHRDVSPQNILVGVDGIARLTDFGVARARSRLGTTNAGRLKGKLTYMAPEQVRCEPVDRRADIYSAGVVLWEMLAGERLMRGDSDAGLVQSILDGVSRSPKDARPGVPKALADVCMRALSPERGARYATAAAMAEAIEAAADEEGVPIATSRAVALFLSELDVSVVSRRTRSVSPDAATLPAGLSSDERGDGLDALKALNALHAPDAHERPTMPDFVASPPDLEATSPAPRTLAGASGSARSAGETPLPRGSWFSRRRSWSGTGAAAGVATAIVLAGWLFASSISGGSDQRARRSEAPAPPTAGSGVPLEPATAVGAPMNLTEPPLQETRAPGVTPVEVVAAPGQRAVTGSPRGTKPKRGAEKWSGEGAASAAPSPTSFRPKEL